MPSADLTARRCPSFREEAESEDEGGGDGRVEDDDDAYWRWRALEGTMILVRKRDSAAPQSITARAAHFHTFILE